MDVTSPSNCVPSGTSHIRWGDIILGPTFIASQQEVKDSFYCILPKYDYKTNIPTKSMLHDHL